MTMEERLSAPRQRGFDRNTLLIVGLILTALGTLSVGILQSRVLGMTTGTDLQQLLDSSENAMSAATAAIVLRAIEAMAVPIFAVLTVDGFQRTSSVKRYFFRLVLLALVCEIPYHLARTGAIWESDIHNPVFGIALSVAMLYLLRSFPGANAKGIAVKIVAPLAAILWALILGAEYATAMVLICYALWLTRRKPTISYFAGICAALLCTVGNMLFLFAPFGFLLAYFYNGTQRPTPRILRYALYPVLLMLIAFAGYAMF